MSQQKRTRLEIIKDILEVINNKKNIKQTKLLCKSNLDLCVLRRYIKELVEKKFIKYGYCPGRKNLRGDEITRGHKLFNITNKGIKFLGGYNLIKIFLEKYGLNDE